MSKIHIALAAAACLAAQGCQSALISATISNHSAAAVSLVEVDYPSASFGVQRLQPGEDFHYRFKVLGSGPTTLVWSDAARHDQKSFGPALREGDEGNLDIVFNGNTGPAWELKLLNRTAAR